MLEEVKLGRGCPSSCPRRRGGGTPHLAAAVLRIGGAGRAAAPQSGTSDELQAGMNAPHRPRRRQGVSHRHAAAPRLPLQPASRPLQLCNHLRSCGDGRGCCWPTPAAVSPAAPGRGRLPASLPLPPAGNNAGKRESGREDLIGGIKSDGLPVLQAFSRRHGAACTTCAAGQVCWAHACAGHGSTAVSWMHLALSNSMHDRQLASGTRCRYGPRR